MAEQRNETPSLAKVIQDMVAKELMEVHTAMPGVIVSYDYGKNMAVVQPSLKRKFKGGSAAVNLPLISNVPVAFPRMGDAHIRFPINPGDEGQLIFNERSIDKWSTLGGTVDPEDPRKFHLSDAVFFPGPNSTPKAMKSKAKQTSIEIKNQKAWIEIMPNGKFKITDGSDEVLLIIKDFLESVNAAFTETLLGPMPLVPPQVYNQWVKLIQRIEKLRGQ